MTALADLVPPPPRERLDVYGNDGTRLNVEVYGPDGAPTVVLAHGWTCSIAFWARQLGALCGDLRVVAFDQRGHGGSAAPGPAGCSIGALADDLAAVLDRAVPRGERAVVAAHSMGAMAGIALADRRPDVLEARVAAALIVSTGMHELAIRHRIVPLPLPLARLAAPLSSKVMAFAPTRGRIDNRLRALIRYVTLSGDAGPAEVDFCTRIIAACPAPVRAGFARTLAELDLDQQVTRFAVPALVIAGDRDRLTPIWHARRMAQALPLSLGLIEVSGAGHMTPVEAAGEVNDAVRRLVADHLTGQLADHLANPLTGHLAGHLTDRKETT